MSDHATSHKDEIDQHITGQHPKDQRMGESDTPRRDEKGSHTGADVGRPAANLDIESHESLHEVPKASLGSNTINRHADAVESQSADRTQNTTPEHGTAPLSGVEDWQALDGVHYHAIVQECVNTRIEDLDRRIDVFNEFDIRGLGRVDTIVETPQRQDVLDYKTDQAAKWTDTKATERGDEYGAKVRGYVDVLGNGQDKPTHGHLVMVGSPPSSEAQASFEAAAERHGVSVLWASSADPTHVADEIARYLGTDEPPSANLGDDEAQK